MKLKNKIALVTGSTKGIGFAIAVSLIRQGATVIFNSRDKEWLNDSSFKEFIEKGYNAFFLPADISKEDQAFTLIDKIIEKYNRIDILVNNVGGSENTPLLAMKSSQLDHIFDLNFKSCFYTMRGVIKSMVVNRFGRIINISSIAGIAGMPMQSHYSAAKAAMIGFSKAIAKELGSKGITCNVVAPGVIKTKKRFSVEEEEEIKNFISTKRIGMPEDISELVAFLASNESSYINGQVFRVDGGMWI